MPYKEEEYVNGRLGILLVLTTFLLLLTSTITSAWTSHQATAQITNPFQTILTNGFATYTNPSLGVKLQYPSNWKVTEENDTVKFRPSSAISPYFEVSHKYLSPWMKSLADLTSANTARISTWASIDQSTPIILAGNLAHKTTFTYTNGQYNEKWMQLSTVKNPGEYYLVTYVGQPLQYFKYLPIVQHMINTISFIPIMTAIPSNSKANSSTEMLGNNAAPKVIIPGVL